MTAQRSDARSPSPTDAEPATDVDVCSTCSHRVENHDALALRFCAATLARALPRGCICAAA